MYTATAEGQLCLIYNTKSHRLVEAYQLQAVNNRGAPSHVMLAIPENCHFYVYARSDSEIIKSEPFPNMYSGVDLTLVGPPDRVLEEIDIRQLKQRFRSVYDEIKNQREEHGRRLAALRNAR